METRRVLPKKVISRNGLVMQHFSSQVVGRPFSRGITVPDAVFGKKSTENIGSVKDLITAWPEDNATVAARERAAKRSLKKASKDGQKANEQSAKAQQRSVNMSMAQSHYVDPYALQDQQDDRRYGRKIEHTEDMKKIVAQDYRKDWVREHENGNSKKHRARSLSPQKDSQLFPHTDAAPRPKSSKVVPFTNAQLARYAATKAKLNPRPDLPGHKLRQFTSPDIKPHYNRSPSPKSKPPRPHSAVAAGAGTVATPQPSYYPSPSPEPTQPVPTRAIYSDSPGPRIGYIPGSPEPNNNANNSRHPMSRASAALVEKYRRSESPVRGSRSVYGENIKISTETQTDADALRSRKGSVVSESRFSQMHGENSQLNVTDFTIIPDIDLEHPHMKQQRKLNSRPGV